MDGKAIVLENGKVYLINEQFEKISNEIEIDAEAVGTLGKDIYAALVDGKCFPLVFE